MAWQKIEPEEDGFEKYPKFNKEGDFVEGNLYEYDTDGYGNKRMVLEVGEDEDGEPLLQYLPSHAHLQKFYKGVSIGDFLHVELVKLIEPEKEGDYPIRKYAVKADPERKVEYDDFDEDEFYEDE